MPQTLDNLTYTWNDSGTTFTGIKYSATDTASAAGSLLMDLQVGGVSQARITKAGRQTLTDITFWVNQTPGGSSTKALWSGPNSTLVIGRAGLGYAFATGNGFGVGDAFGWGTNDSGGVPDIVLARDAANTLAQRRSTNAQTFRLYGTYTDTSNYRRLALTSTTGGAFTLSADGLGSGLTGNTLAFATDGTTRLTIASTGAATFTQRVTCFDLFIDRAASGRVAFVPTADGSFTVSNNNGNDFGRMQFGGTTSSYPSLKRSSTSLIVRLADDSANAPLESASVKTDAPAGGTSGTWKLGVAAIVSPTSPNRTIEVDIGGTIYYLHAKTTND